MEPGELNCDTGSGQLTLNSVLMHRAAFCIPDLLPLRPKQVRGSDRIKPGAVGVLGGRRRITVVQWQLAIFVTGLYDTDGVRFSTLGLSRYQVLESNLDYLDANTGIGFATGDGTVTATWNREAPLGDLAAAVHNLGFGEWTRHGLAVVEGRLTLSCPAGTFA